MNTDTWAFLAGGGEMGELIRTNDWSQTAIGQPDQWPNPLRIVLSLLLHAQAPMFLWWGSELIQFYNDTYRPSLGSSGKHPTALGQRGVECWPETWPTIKPLIDQVLAGNSVGAEDQLIPIYRNGRLENVYWTFGYSPVLDETGQVAGVLVICQETTQKVAFARESQERFRFAIEAAQFGIWDVDPVSNRVHWDQRSAGLFGLSSSQAIPYQTAIGYIHPDDKNRVNEAVRRIMSPHSDGHYDLTYRTIGAEDGILRWVRFQGRSVFNLEGGLDRFSGVAQEVTQEVLARQAVKANADYLQRVFRSAAVGMAIFEGPQFVIEVANPSVCAIWGRTEAQVLGKPLFEALPEAAGQGFEELLAGVMATSQPFVGKELPAIIYRQGQFTTVYFDFVYEPLPEADGRVTRILVTASDATERRRARHQIEASETKLRTLFAQAPVAIAILRGPELVYEMANQQYLGMVGRDDHKDLIDKPMLVALPELINQGLDSLLQEVMRTGEAFRATERSIELFRNGQLETGYFNFNYEPLQQIDGGEQPGAVSGVFVMATEVTQQVLARQQTDNLLIRERELNELKSNFVTLASHEFRTPMGTILSSVSLISRYNGPDEADKRERHVQRIKSAVLSLTGLLNDFLSLSQMEQATLYGHPHPLDIQLFCEEVMEDMEGIIKPGQRLVYQHRAGQTSLSIDSQMLKNILINLLVNASKYSAHGKEIELTTAVDDRQLIISVKDEGIGIPDTDKDKLFISFFRSRNVANVEGTGLGLYVVKRYVDLLGGTISFTSELNSGTTFTIQLPLTTSTP
ncbi:hypothetical protein GCM10028808_56980 [Spirosoma migulaei]